MIMYIENQRSSSYLFKETELEYVKFSRLSRNCTVHAALYTLYTYTALIYGCIYKLIDNRRSCVRQTLHKGSHTARLYIFMFVQYRRSRRRNTFTMNQTKVQFFGSEDEKLVNVMSNFSCIYDSESPMYKNHSVKDNAWMEIAEYVERSGKKKLYIEPMYNIVGITSANLRLRYYRSLTFMIWGNVCMHSTR